MFSDCNFKNTVFKNLSFFTDADFTYCDFNNSYFENIDFNECQFGDEIYEKCNITCCIFKNVPCKTNFKNTNLVGCTFENCINHEIIDDLDKIGCSDLKKMLILKILNS